MPSKLPYVWTGVFGYLVFVPLTFAILLFSLVTFVLSSPPAAIFIGVAGFLSAASFVLSAAFFHTLLLSAVFLDRKGELTTLAAFKAMRTRFKRVLWFDTLALLLTLPGVILLWLAFANQSNVYLVLAAVYGCLHAFLLLEGSFLLEKHPAHKALWKSVRCAPGKRSKLFVGMLVWTAIPYGAWLLLTWGTHSTFTLTANAFALLLGQQHVFWLYLSNPASVLNRFALVAISIAYAVSATVWLGRATQQLKRG